MSISQVLNLGNESIQKAADNFRDTSRGASGSISRAPTGRVEGLKKTGQVHSTSADRSLMPVAGDGRR